MKFNDTKYHTSLQHIVYSKNMLSVHLILSAERELGRFISVKYPEEVAKAWQKMVWVTVHEENTVSRSACLTDICHFLRDSSESLCFPDIYVETVLVSAL